MKEEDKQFLSDAYNIEVTEMKKPNEYHLYKIDSTDLWYYWARTGSLICYLDYKTDNRKTIGKFPRIKEIEELGAFIAKNSH